jgi:glyoxylase-like metal-dependent hydrolase (beta-lactamase superfamily II)
MIDARVISIGCLSAHPLWGERAPVRTGHATTTLIRSSGATILVDPGLPEQVIAARLSERAGITPEQVTHVFLSSFHPETHRGLGAFPEATWLIHHDEREGQGVPLVHSLKRAADAGERDVVSALEREVAILQRCRPAPDRLAPGVDLFPLPGVTPGTCGLLVALNERTLLIAGDAAPTGEHVRRGMVLPVCFDVNRARESLAEAIQIADLLIPGRDNLIALDAGPGGPTPDAADTDD